MDGKSKAWQDGASELLEALALENKYLVSDMLIVFLESSGYGLDNYSALGPVFKAAAKKGIIKRMPGKRKPVLWRSEIFRGSVTTARRLS